MGKTARLSKASHNAIALWQRLQGSPMGDYLALERLERALELVPRHEVPQVLAATTAAKDGAK